MVDGFRTTNTAKGSFWIPNTAKGYCGTKTPPKSPVSYTDPPTPPKAKEGSAVTGGYTFSPPGACECTVDCLTHRGCSSSSLLASSVWQRPRQNAGGFGFCGVGVLPTSDSDRPEKMFWAAHFQIPGAWICPNQSTIPRDHSCWAGEPHIPYLGLLGVAVGILGDSTPLHILPHSVKPITYTEAL